MTQRYFPCSCCSLGGTTEAPCLSTQEVAALVGALLDIEHEIIAAADGGDAASTVLAIVEGQLGKPPRPYPPRHKGEPAYADPAMAEGMLHKGDHDTTKGEGS